MARPRDYTAEYARRIARGQARGLSRSQARGHPRIGESLVAPPRYPAASRRASATRLEQGLRLLFRPTDPLSIDAAAKSARVAPERLRGALAESKFAQKHGGRWVVAQDNLERDELIYTQGRRRVITVRGPEPSALIGRYANAVGRFLTTNNADVLEPFRDVLVTDIRNRRYRLETRPNVLYRIASASTPTFEQVYRIRI